MSKYLLREMQVLIHLEGVGHQLKAFNLNQGSYTSKRQGYYAKFLHMQGIQSYNNTQGILDLSQIIVFR